MISTLVLDASERIGAVTLTPGQQPVVARGAARSTTQNQRLDPITGQELAERHLHTKRKRSTRLSVIFAG